MLTASLLDRFGALAALGPEWETLLARSSSDEPTLSPPWILSWWRVFGDGGRRRLRVLAFRDGDRLVGLAPLLARPHFYPPAIPFRRLELLASGEREADETCSEYLGVIAERGREADVAFAFARALADGTAGPWDELTMGVMNGESPLPALLVEELGARGFAAGLSDCGTAPFATLPASWDAYLASLPPGRRQYVRKSLRAFERWADGRHEIVRVTEASEIDEARRVLTRLHAARWPGGGVFASARFAAFHAAVMPAFLARGALGLGWLSARGEPVAAFYNLVWREKEYFYQSGRTQAVPPQVRVGVVMHAYLLRSAIERGLREYDFLAGTSRYKLTFAGGARSLVTLRATRPSAAEAARRLADRAIGALRGARDRARRHATTLAAALDAARPGHAPRPGPVRDDEPE